LIPFANARLKKIEGEGFTENYGDDETAGNAKWSGNANACLREEVLSQLNGEQVDQVRISRLTFELGPPVAVGDTVTYEQDGVEVKKDVDQIDVNLDAVGLVRVHFPVE
jgi:hypothetical protein